VLSPSKIVVIAADAALRHSLTFALEVEGYQVEAHEAWRDCRTSPVACLCKIIDEEVVQNSSDARRYMLDATNAVILLADGLSPMLENSPARILLKPFEGSDLVHLVKSLTLAA
jgi:hypothetical protein